MQAPSPLSGEPVDSSNYTISCIFCSVQCSSKNSSCATGSACVANAPSFALMFVHVLIAPTKEMQRMLQKKTKKKTEKSMEKMMWMTTMNSKGSTVS